MNKANITALVVSVIGALKLVLNAFGVDLLANVDENAVANAIATLVAVGGPIFMHFLHKKQIKAVQAAPAPAAAPQKPAGK